MKRHIASALCSAVVIASLGMSGCGGGTGIDEGVPKDTTPGVPLDQGIMPLGTKGTNKPKAPEAPKPGDSGGAEKKS